MTIVWVGFFVPFCFVFQCYLYFKKIIHVYHLKKSNHLIKLVIKKEHFLLLVPSPPNDNHFSGNHFQLFYLNLLVTSAIFLSNFYIATCWFFSFRLYLLTYGYERWEHTLFCLFCYKYASFLFSPFSVKLYSGLISIYSLFYYKYI